MLTCTIYRECNFWYRCNREVHETSKKLSIRYVKRIFFPVVLKICTHLVVWFGWSCYCVCFLHLLTLQNSTGVNFSESFRLCEEPSKNFLIYKPRYSFAFSRVTLNSSRSLTNIDSAIVCFAVAKNPPSKRIAKINRSFYMICWFDGWSTKIYVLFSQRDCILSPIASFHFIASFFEIAYSKVACFQTSVTESIAFEYLVGACIVAKF